MKRIVILVNKDFEYAGFIEGLRNVVPVYAGMNGRQAECRFDNLIADIYCIQNLFKPGENSSNSELKYGYLKELFASNAFRLEDADAVLSVSTSETTPDVQGNYGTLSRNGCVYIGNKFYLTDQSEHDKTTDSHLVIGTPTDRSEFYGEKPMWRGLYEIINEVKMSFKLAEINPCVEPRCFADYNNVCVGVVNVMDYSRYVTADEAAYKQFNESSTCKTNGTPIGLETTHGVVMKALHEVCSKTRKPFPAVMFISPIVDRYLKFDEDVDGKYGKQNFICSYNGGVATGHIATVLNAWYTTVQ